MDQTVHFKRHRAIWRFIWRPTWLWTRLRYNYHPQTQPIDGPALIVSNHVTDLDPFLVALTVKNFAYFVASSHVFSNPKTAKLIDWDLWQTQELRRCVLSGEGICLASDADMELYEVAGDYTETPAAHGRMALYRDRMEIDSLCMPLSDISGMSVIGPQALIFTCRGTSYTVRSKAVRNMRKYLTLYEILKTNSFIA